MRLAFLTLVAASIALPASAQVRVAMGEQVVFTLDAGAAVEVKREEAAPNPYERALAQEFGRGDHDDAIGANGVVLPARRDRPAAPPPEPGKIRARFTPALREAHSLLVIDNGYDQGLVYRATIGVDGKSGPTDVCLVMPGKATIEHWPYKIAWIELRDFRLVPWKPGDGLPCA
ncbi:hypothetical protein FHS95_003166 [Sphingomonas naasensis]|uniref:Uncharacterized protein n=1 Tax=Sphingomonas naasensis TaxID=1344951 RepID=A0A4S1WIR8_9SPHN|nr:hypothetical protein [Sphingomonas naasensis]NIJ21463.1 hypothetical protein [Sphingomonas naasensis]TGX41580.1 hypothetical protein E5A74_13280 [Sphingomonas naasensis]